MGNGKDWLHWNPTLQLQAKAEMEFPQVKLFREILGTLSHWTCLVNPTHFLRSNSLSQHLSPPS